MDTAVIAELEACDGETYKTLRETFHRGQKLSQFAEQCKEMCMNEPLQSVIEQKRKMACSFTFAKNKSNFCLKVC